MTGITGITVDYGEITVDYGDSITVTDYGDSLLNP